MVLVEQRGFIAGRSIVDSVIAADTATALTTVDEASDAAAIAFDFSTAFPSLSQHFIEKTLRGMRLPAALVQGVLSLYINVLVYFVLFSRSPHPSPST